MARAPWSLDGLNPAQQFIDIVYQELTEIMGGTAPEHPLDFASKPPTVVMMVGLQGAGKTTTCGKLAKFLKKLGRSPLLVPRRHPAPRRRGAAPCRGQGRRSAELPHRFQGSRGPSARPPWEEARIKGWDTVILDTAGRLHLDEQLMNELVRIQEGTQPNEILFVADAMTGQDAVRSATRLPREAGPHGRHPHQDRWRHPVAARPSASSTPPAAPSSSWARARSWTTSSASTPDRMAQRILGMGDVLTLIEQAKDKIDEKEAEAMAQKLVKNQFTLEDMRQPASAGQEDGFHAEAHRDAPGHWVR